MDAKCPTCGHEFDPQAAPGLKGACPRCVAELLRSQPGDASGLLRPSASETSEASAKEVAPVREDDAPPLQPGAKLRGFEVLEYLGRGGMGFVYKARQSGLDRTVALKVLAPRLAASPEFAARFGREAKALAALSHPNIVQVFDYGEEGGLYFLAMEFVDGTTLRRILSSQKISPETALRYVPQICDALEYAHGRGIIHRDIKPENILIDKVGNLKIADFGLAKMVGAAVTPDADTTPASHATASGQVMGTPHYMAPEQVENTATVDHRADIYALGVVFYEMLTGELPLGRFPSPSQKVQVDVRFDEVVLKALEKEPQRRYQTVTDMKGDVATLGASGEKPGSKVSVHSRDGKKVVEIGPDGIRVENGDKRVVIGGGLGNLIGSAASAAAGAQGIAARPRMSLLALASALCLPASAIFGLLAGVLAYLFSGSERPGEPVFWVALLSATVILLLGLTLGITALSRIGGSGGRLTGRGLAWTGILSLPIVGLFMLAGLVHERGTGVLKPSMHALNGTTGSEIVGAGKATENASWGQPVDGLQAGLMISQKKCQVGQSLTDVHIQLKNVGSVPVRFANDPLQAASWSFRFEDSDGSRPAVEFHLAESSEGPGLFPALGAGEACGFVEDQLDNRWETKGAGAPDQRLRPSGLPSGKYRLTGTYRGKAGAGLWQGTISTGPVEIEIVEPGKPVAAKTESPAAKYLTDQRDMIGLGSCFIGEVLSIGPLAPFTVQSGAGALRGERKLREVEYRVDEVLWNNEESIEGGLKLRKGAKVRILHELPPDGSLPAQFNQGQRLIVHFGWLNMANPKGSHPGSFGAIPATPVNVRAFRDAHAKAQAPIGR